MLMKAKGPSIEVRQLSYGAFSSFSRTCGSLSHMFVKKNGLFRPAGGDIPRQMWDRRIHVSSGKFAGFAHFAAFVVPTPTA
jgi:hypothetical protein